MVRDAGAGRLGTESLGACYPTIGFNLLNPPTANSQEFTVRAAPECLWGCFHSSAGLTTANSFTGAAPIVY